VLTKRIHPKLGSGPRKNDFIRYGLRVPVYNRNLRCLERDIYAVAAWRCDERFTGLVKPNTLYDLKVACSGSNESRIDGEVDAIAHLGARCSRHEGKGGHLQDFVVRRLYQPETGPAGLGAGDDEAAIPLRKHCASR
jgi:hypothetical protein